MTSPPVESFIQSIKDGSFDSELSQMQNAIDQRRISLRTTRTVLDFPIGTIVKFNEFCGTSYLRGTTATVTASSRTRITVLPTQPIGRFVRLVQGVAHSAAVKVPLSIVDIV